MLQIAFLVAVWYAWLDWKYIRNGGIRPKPAEVIAWTIGGGVIFLAAWGVMFFVLGINELSEFSSVLLSILVVIFVLYEARRWTVRRDNPIRLEG